MGKTQLPPPMAVGLSQSLAQQSGTVSKISPGTHQSALTLSAVYWRRICLRDTIACSALVLEVDNFIRYIDLLTYLLTTRPNCKTKNRYIVINSTRVITILLQIQSVVLPYRMITTRLGPFHCRYPLVVVTEKRQVEERTRAVRLGTDRQLCKYPPHRLCATPIPRTGDRVLKPLVRLPSVNICRRRACKIGNSLAVRLRGRISQKITEVLVQGQKVVGRAVINSDDFGGGDVVNDEEWWLRVRILGA